MTQRIPAGARVAILCNHDLGTWRHQHALGTRAGQLGPYGFEHLASRGFSLRWSDARHRPPLSSSLARRVEAKVVWHRPELAGWVTTAVSANAIHRADATIAMFEDQGLALARVRRQVPKLRRKPFVLVSCWLGESLRRIPPGTRASIAGALSTVDAIVVFSHNQVPIIADGFGVSPERLHCVPFGIDSAFFSPDSVRSTGLLTAEGTSGGRIVLSVGRDESRDLDTLIAAAPRIRGTVHLVTGRGQLAGRALPPNLVVSYDVDHTRYRRLLGEAAVVCLPTKAPAYPSGQTVLLEAMAMSRPCVITDSPAIRDYVVDDRTAVLVKAADPGALASSVNAILDDRDRAASLGSEARLAVTGEFHHARMWRGIGGVITHVMGRGE